MRKTCLNNYNTEDVLSEEQLDEYIMGKASPEVCFCIEMDPEYLEWISEDFDTKRGKRVMSAFRNKLKECQENNGA